MNLFAKFDEIPSMIFQDIKEQKVMSTRSDSRTDRRSDNMKTLYPPTNTVWGGIKTSLAKFEIIVK